MIKPLAITEEIEELLAAGAPVAIGVSGGKDSCAVAFATVEYLKSVGHTGEVILVHSDLGRVEWKDSAPTCERLAEALGVELLTVKREAGDMLARWQGRWSNNVARYVDLSCVKLILPWSTASMRFCTSELKTDIICRALSRRFPGQTIISVNGIRREESANRAKAPVTKVEPKLANKTRKTRGLSWHPIIDWSAVEVFSELRSRGFRLHEAYETYGSSRVSCAFCILASAADLKASAACPDNADVYRLMVELEAESTFSFTSSYLGDVAPELLGDDLAGRLTEAKTKAARREEAEARIPKHLLYVKGWPVVVPTIAEAELMAEVRREVGELLGLDVKYTDAASIIDRHQELMYLADHK